MICLLNTIYTREDMCTTLHFNLHERTLDVKNSRLSGFQRTKPSDRIGENSEGLLFA